MNKRENCQGLTLLELLVAVTVVIILASLAVPAVTAARGRAAIGKSASNLRQIHAAFMMYVMDHDDMMFWRDADPVNNGMEWYVYGGRESGNDNTGQENLFNRLRPRPLNRYIPADSEVYRCPEDRGAAYLAGRSHYDNVGNSYMFNAFGSPWAMDRAAGGLAGYSFSSISDPAQTVCFADTSVIKGGIKWYNRSQKGNICYADGHVEYTGRPAALGKTESDPGWGVIPADPSVPPRLWDIQ